MSPLLDCNDDEMRCQVRAKANDDRNDWFLLIILPILFLRPETIPGQELAECRRVIPRCVLGVNRRVNPEERLRAGVERMGVRRYQTQYPALAEMPPRS